MAICWTPRSRAFCSCFPSCRRVQALLVRMVMRKGPWFRASKLVYEEIPRTTEAAAPLEMGWISADAPMELAELFGLHTKPELLKILKGAGLGTALQARDAGPDESGFGRAGRAGPALCLLERASR